jgi:hypothetical protein
MGEDINWFAGKGPSNPNSDTFVSDKFVSHSTQKLDSVGADVWAGMTPKGEIPVNENIEVKSLDEKAGGLAEARKAVLNGVRMALAEIPFDISKVTYEPAGGGIYQVVESGRVIGYADRQENNKQELN